MQTIRLTPEDAALDIARRAIDLAGERGRRVLVALAGGPGSGKSTIAADVVERLNVGAGRRAALIPMDGFHMHQDKLRELGLAAGKGAPQTFEAGLFVDTLKQLKSSGADMLLPTYSRAIEDVIPDALPIPSDIPILVAEGNYLLLDSDPWNRIADIVDLSVHIEAPREIVRERLLKRHAEHGLFTAERNLRHVETVDLANYDLAAACKGRADLVIEIETKS